MRGVSPACITRFQADLARLVNPQHVRLGVAVSGGGDSLALLLLAHHALPGCVHAATVDHGLRAEAADEARFVADICAQLNVPHAILSPAQPIAGSIQAAARLARYAALTMWADDCGCNWIATAHHIDDQAETLLMRLNRGSGVAGLAGVRAMNGRLIRPLLGWRRSELAQVVADAGIEAIDDPSNHDTEFDRVRIRQHLAASPWLETDHIARSATLLAEANTALDWATVHLAKDRLNLGSDSAKLDPGLLPRELRRRLTLMALQHVDPDIAPRGAALVALIEALGNGETRTLGEVEIKGGALWRFRRATPRRKK